MGIRPRTFELRCATDAKWQVPSSWVEKLDIWWWNRFLTPRLSLVAAVLLTCLSALPGAPARAAFLYSVDNVSDELVCVDSDSGTVVAIGPIGTHVEDCDLALFRGKVFLLDTVWEVGSRLMRLDPRTGAALWVVPVTFQGNPVLLAEGLAADSNGLLVSFRTAAAFNAACSNALGRLDSLGAISGVNDFALSQDSRADADGLGIGLIDPHVFWIDASIPPTNNIRLLDVTLNPPAMSIISQSQPYRAINDLALAAGVLLGMNSSTHELVRIDPESGAILAVTAIRQQQRNLFGLAPALAPVCTDVIPLVSPMALELRPGLPNPFNPATSFAYVLPSDGLVLLTVHDVRGRQIVTLVNTVQPSGLHAASWDGRDAGGATLSSGIYFVRLASGGKARTRKIVLAR